MTKAELAKQIKASRLYKLYHNPTDEIDRSAPEGVNASGQATDRMMQLQRAIKDASKRETDFPPELRSDADELRELIQTGIVTLFADSEDGEITPADFKTVFNPLAGMTEGMLTALSFDDPDKMMSLRSMRTECADKAFYRQLRKTLHEASIGSNHGRERMFAFGKALSSFGTHLFIKAEKGGHLPTGLVEEVGEIVSSLNRKASRGTYEFADEVRRVRGWGLVEGAGMSPVKGDRMPANQTSAAPGLSKKGKGDVKGPSDDDTDYKPGGGAKADVAPPQLDQSPGNPKDVPAGKDAKQDGKWMDGKLKTTIDGVPSEEPPKQPKTEAVEFLVRIPEHPGRMEWNIRTGGKVIGEAWRRVFLGGSDHHADIKASELSTALRESDGIPGDGIKVDAPDIFRLQLKVVEEMNRVAAELGQGRRFTIAR